MQSIRLLLFHLGLMAAGCLLSGAAVAQPSSFVSPYQLSWAVDAPLSLGGLGLSVGGFGYQSQISPLATRDLLQLDVNDIGRFDRVAASGWRPAAARLSDIGLIGGFVAPFALLASRRIRGHAGQHLLLWFEMASWVNGLTTWAKVLTLRNRPFNYYYAATYSNTATIDPDLAKAVTQRDARFSFFSGHSSHAAAYSFFFAQTFADYYPNSAAKPWVWAGAALLPAAVSYLRVRAGKHYPSDVLVGYLLGAAIGVGIPYLHQKQ